MAEHRGNVTDVCGAVGVGRTQFYNWKKQDEVFAIAVDNIEDMNIDYVESKLLENIDKNDTIAILFYLKTKGKKRGYIERQEIGLSGNLLTTPKLTDEQFEQLLKHARENRPGQ